MTSEKYKGSDVETTSHYSNVRAKEGNKGPLLLEKGRKKNASVKESVDNGNHDGYNSTMGVENHLHSFSAVPPWLSAPLYSTSV